MKTFKFILNYFSIFILLILMYEKISMDTFSNSDAVSGLLEGKDIAAGNVFLRGWNLSTVSFYFTEIIWYALATKISGYGAWQAYIVPSALFSVMTLSAIFLSIKDGKFNLFPLIIGFALPGAFAAQNMLVPIIHIGSYLYIILCFIFIDRFYKSGCRVSAIFYLTLLPLTLFSDGISVYLLIVPVMLSYSYEYLRTKKSRAAIIIAMTIISYILAKCIAWFFKLNDGFFIPGVPTPAFVKFDEIWNNFYLLIKGLIVFFNADIFGKSPATPDTMLKLLHMITMICLFSLFFMVMRGFKKFSSLDMTIAIAAFIMIPAYLISNLPIDIYTIRYLVPTFIFGSILISRNISLRSSLSMLLTFFTIILALVTWRMDTKIDYSQDVFNQLKLEIRKNNLVDGYASFWFASSISIDGDISVSPIDVDSSNGTIQPKLWLSNNILFKQGGDFFIVDNDRDIDIFKSKFGQPIKEIKVAGKTILVYREKIKLM